MPYIDRFIEYVSRIVGNANVITEPKELEKYSKDHSFVKPALPSCVVKPDNIEEVQEILKLSNELAVPITPLSGGTNNLGGTIPSPNGVVLDLRRMNRILEIDPRANMALIEPGVTFKQVQDYVMRYGLRVLTPSELPSTSSVLSTYLDLVPLYGWIYYAEENLTTMTIVLPDGSIVKTGQAAFPQIKHPYMHSHGSPFAGLMNYIWYQSQGTLGVVLQGWIKLKPLWEAEKAFFIPIHRIELLHTIIREIAWLRYARDMIIMNKMDVALMFAEETSNYENKVREIRANLPEWLIGFVLRGRSDAIEVMEADINDILRKYDLKLLQELPGVPKAEEILRQEVLYPSGWIKFSRYRGARTSLPFIASIKDIPTIYRTLYTLSEKYGYPREDIGITLIPTISIGVAAYNISFARDSDDANEYMRTKKFYYDVAETLVNLGAFYSRPYGILAKIMYTRSQTYYEVLMKIKRLIDPKNIMNPRRLRILEDSRGYDHDFI